MRLQITFKKPNIGIFKIYISSGEKLQFSYGRVRRIPADKDSAFNTGQVKYITSIKFTNDGKCCQRLIDKKISILQKCSWLKNKDFFHLKKILKSKQ